MSSEFYEKLAADYDRLIPWDKRLRNERPQFEKLFSGHNVKTILDASCGTGRHLMMFSDMGYDVTGADGSAKMVELSKRNIAAAGAQIPLERLHALPWSKLEDVPGQFDAVLCIGNSLPYVTEVAELKRSLAGLWSKVAPGGLLLIQFKNFEKLYSTRQRFLPVTSAPPPNEMIGLRMYDYHVNHVDFNIILLDRTADGWSMRHQVTPLAPYRGNEIVEELEAIGASATLYGCLEMSKFEDTESEDCTVLASAR